MMLNNKATAKPRGLGVRSSRKAPSAVRSVRCSCTSSSSTFSAPRRAQKQDQDRAPRADAEAASPLRRASAALLSGLVSVSLMLPGARRGGFYLC